MAATAYAALRSLMTTIAMEQTPTPLHPPFPFSPHVIEALLERVRFMLHFLEQGWKGAEHLEHRITQLAYAAEDAIEIPIVDQIRSRNKIRCIEEVGPAPSPLGQDLESLIHDLDLIKVEMLQDVDLAGSSSSTNLSTAPPQWGKSKMVGFEEDKSKIIAELKRYDNQPGLQIIPIIGMGGIGKTTLARNVFDDKHIMMHFDVRAWVMVSQEYNVNDIVKGVLYSIQNQESAGNSKEQVYKSLFNRRYLVIFDDMWSTDIWDEIKQYFPDNNNGSRIMVTTRLKNLAAELSTGFRLQMKCLDVENSWNLFCEKVFAQKSCPLKLQKVGKKIVQSCRGLPLAIVVIGCLLAKSSQTLRYWEHVALDFYSYLYSSDDDHFSKILFLSYTHLPVHLKPCLLYLGVFPEDCQICVSKLMRLWIAEGFLKPLEGKTLEEIAEEYLKDLIERDFIIVSTYSSMGKIKNIIIHDLLRELCLREAQKEMFYCVVTEKWFVVPRMGYQRRIVIRKFGKNTTKYSHLCGSLRSKSHVRTLIFTMQYRNEVHVSLPIVFSAFLLLRISFSLYHSIIPPTDTFMPSLVNMRYLAIGSANETHASRCATYSSIGLFRNFQMIDDTPCGGTPIQIWNLVQLHQVKSSTITLPEPSYCIGGQHNHIVLENLQSLSTLRDFRFSEEAIKRFPNVKKLKVVYWTYKKWSYYCAHNLELLKKLESFSYSFYGLAPNRKEFLQSVAFPPSLKKLSLFGCKLRWEDMTVFGSLPHLEVLKLSYKSIDGQEWNSVQGNFRHLKFLQMHLIRDLMNWNADSTHFPCLEQLHLLECSNLKEIPLGIGEISTLQLIQMRSCSVSAMMSAKNILEEQLKAGNHELVVKVTTPYKYASLHDVKIKNFVATSWFVGYAERRRMSKYIHSEQKRVA